jgi:hypothetical protein
MKEEKKDEVVQIEVGQVIDISLESMMGSTGYGWELSELSGPICLIGISVIPVSTRVVAPVSQVFHIKGIGIGKACVKFVLAAAWKLEEPAQTITYQINIVKAVATAENDLKIKGFIGSQKTTVRDAQDVKSLYSYQPPVVKYGVPCDDAYERLYYGVLPQSICNSDPRLYYGVCCAPQTDPRVYYGVCCAPDNDMCCAPPQVLKYGILPRPMYNVYAPIQKYNIPPLMRYNFPDKCE